MNRTVEELFASFAARSGLEEIRNFSVISEFFKKKSGRTGFSCESRDTYYF